MKKGFTLIELLAVVLIMGSLTAIALPQYRRSVERTRVAEALQMMPALFEARERLVAEWGYPTYENTPIAKQAQVTFAKLDIEMKGKPGTKPQRWQTDNFDYTSAPDAFVGAVFTKGVYKGVGLGYAGNHTVRCCYTTTKEACDVLNIPFAVSMSTDSFCKQITQAL